MRVKIEKIVSSDLKRYVKKRWYYKSTLFENEIGFRSKCFNIPLFGTWLLKFIYGKHKLGIE